MKMRFVLSLIIILLVGIFAIQNSQIIVIKFLFLRINISLALIILISFVIGGIMGIFVSSTKYGVTHRKNKSEGNKKIQDKN